MRTVYGLITAAALVTAVVMHAQSEQSPAPALAPTPAITDAKLGTRLTGFKTEAAAGVDDLRDYTQKMVDSVFSFGDTVPGSLQNSP